MLEPPLGSELQRRSSYHNLRRMESSPPDFCSRPEASTGSATSISSSGGSSPRGYFYGVGKRSQTTVTGILVCVAALGILVSLAVYNAGHLGLRNISTSYVNVNYMPNLVNAGFFRSDEEAADALQRASLHSNEQEFIRVKLRRGAKLLRGEHMGASPETGGARWPPETPDWEQCTARDDPEKIRSTGTVIGYFSMYLRCPAAPEYTPTTTFAPPVVRDHSEKRPTLGELGPELLIGVFSGCNARKRRDTVRKTWYRLRHSTEANVKIVFVMSRDCTNDVESEDAEHGDMFFSDVKESYYTLTPKAFALLQLGVKQGAKYVLKTDDDSFIFIDRLVSELQRLSASQQPTPDGKQPLLYWGRRCSVPLLTDGGNPKLKVLSDSASKWYYPPHYLRHFEGTAYMCGAAYLLSQSLAKNVLIAEEKHRLAVEAPFLPEDASVGHLVGPEGWERASCQDHRFILDVRRYHGRFIFSRDVDACKRADIFSHAISAHGLQPEHMETIFNYNLPATGEQCFYTVHSPVCQGVCNVDTHLREDRRVEQPFDEWIWAEHLAPLGPQFPEINWKLRLEQLPAKRPPVDSGLVPISSLLKAQHTPWCMRHLWSIQIAEILEDLSAKHVLECMMGMDQIFVDSQTLKVTFNEASDTLAVYGQNDRFSKGIPCFADNMCDRCFLRESREGMFGTMCSPITMTCQGYDASHQAKVTARKVLYPLIGRFMHDTPMPQDKYRAAVDAALHVPDTFNGSASVMTSAMSRALADVYKSYGGHKCSKSWMDSLEEALMEESGSSSQLHTL